MVGIVIKAIIGLFIWLMLPQIISKKRKLKRNTKTFFNIACFILGIAIIALAGIDLVKFLLNFN